MIPTILTDTGAGKSASTGTSTPDADTGRAEAFGDVFALTKTEAAQLPMQDAPIEVATPGTDVSAEDVPDMGLSVVADLRADTLKGAKSSLAEAQPLPLLPDVQGKLITQGTPQKPEVATPKTTQVTPPTETSDADQAEQTSTIKRSSVAQSVVESRLPPSAATTAGDTTALPKTARDALVKLEPTKPDVAAVRPEAPPSKLSSHELGTVPVPTMPGEKLVKALQPEDTGKHRRERTVTPTVTPQVAAVLPTHGPPVAAVAAATPAALQAAQLEKLSKSFDAEVSVGLGGAERGTSVGSTVNPAGAPANPETARHVAQQIAVSVLNAPGKTTEIALNPEELGRVRLSLTAADGVLTLAVLAERPETQDLLRRHIDVLAQEFRELGYDSISFSFSHEGQSGAEAEQDHIDEQPKNDAAEIPLPDMTAPRGPTSGLDLRI